MKARTKAPKTVENADPKAPRKNAPRKSIENRDLNTDDDQTTNAAREEDWDTTKTSDSRSVSDTSVEEEGDREAKRKNEDNHPEEWMK